MTIAWQRMSSKESAIPSGGEGDRRHNTQTIYTNLDGQTIVSADQHREKPTVLEKSHGGEDKRKNSCCQPTVELEVLMNEYYHSFI